MKTLFLAVLLFVSIGAQALTVSPGDRLDYLITSNPDSQTSIIVMPSAGPTAIYKIGPELSPRSKEAKQLNRDVLVLKFTVQTGNPIVINDLSLKGVTEAADQAKQNFSKAAALLYISALEFGSSRSEQDYEACVESHK